MIRGDFTQEVRVAGFLLRVSNLSIRESDDEPVSQIDFQVKADYQSQDALNALVIGAELAITQAAQGRVVGWVADVESLRLVRADHEDVYYVQASGEAKRLTLRRFTEAFEDLTASQIIRTAMSKHGAYSGIGTLLVDQNDTDIGAISARQDTLLDVIDRVAKRAGWTWRIDAGQLVFQDPEDYVAPFELRSAENIERSGFEYTEDLAEVRNVIRAEAYEYQNVVVETQVNGCVQAVYGPKFDETWQFAGLSRITSPDELREIPIEVDTFTGRIEFQQPLVLESEIPDPIPDDWDPAETQQFPLRIEYLIRQKLLAERRDEGSISIYGERHAVFNPSNGGDSIEAVFQMLDTEIRRKAFPLTTAKATVTDFGLRPGMIVSVLPFGRQQPVSMRVSSLQHTTSGVELQIQVELASRTYNGSDPVPELFERVANLEKRDLDPRSPAGLRVQETGSIVPVPSIRETLGWSYEQLVYFAGQGIFSGGGSFGVSGFAFGGEAALFSGAGSLNVTPSSRVEQMAIFTGGGSIFAMRGAEGTGGGPFSGAGELLLTVADFPRVEAGITGGGSISAMRGAEHEDAGTITGGGFLLLTEAPGYGAQPLAISGGGAFNMVQIPDNVRMDENLDERITEAGDYRVAEG